MFYLLILRTQAISNIYNQQDPNKIDPRMTSGTSTHWTPQLSWLGVVVLLLMVTVGRG